jgi:hypothetical protein
MKLVRQDEAGFEFHLGGREKSVLRGVLEAYPLIPPSYHRLTRGTGAAPAGADQTLLTESMAAHKAESRRRVDSWLAEEKRFVRHGQGFRVRFSREELDELLRVLNDVRVGSWLRLGSPDPEAEMRSQPTQENVRYLALMEVAGHFEYLVLAALDGTDGVGWGGREE